MIWNELSIDNLPPFNVPCIVFGEGVVGVATLKGVVIYKSGEIEKVTYEFVEYNSSYTDYVYTVTHWMNLPKPPI